MSKLHLALELWRDTFSNISVIPADQLDDYRSGFVSGDASYSGEYDEFDDATYLIDVDLITNEVGVEYLIAKNEEGSYV